MTTAHLALCFRVPHLWGSSKPPAGSDPSTVTGSHVSPCCVFLKKPFWGLSPEGALLPCSLRAGAGGVIACTTAQPSACCAELINYLISMPFKKFTGQAQAD